jgi:CheY-like chemotaxis protein
MFGGKKQRVLVAEDDVHIRTILKFTLESGGFEVTEVGDGRSALEQARKLKPDAILLDVMMPHKNGLEVCYELKNDPKMAHIPIMILTATTQASVKSDDHWRVRSRADDFVTKPFKSAEVVKRVRELIAACTGQSDDSKPRFRI